MSVVIPVVVGSSVSTGSLGRLVCCPILGLRTVFLSFLTLSLFGFPRCLFVVSCVVRSWVSALSFGCFLRCPFSGFRVVFWLFLALSVLGFPRCLLVVPPAVPSGVSALFLGPVMRCPFLGSLHGIPAKRSEEERRSREEQRSEEDVFGPVGHKESPVVIRIPNTTPSYLLAVHHNVLSGDT